MNCVEGENGAIAGAEKGASKLYSLSLSCFFHSLQYCYESARTHTLARTQKGVGRKNGAKRNRPSFSLPRFSFLTYFIWAMRFFSFLFSPPEEHTNCRERTLLSEESCSLC